MVTLVKKKIGNQTYYYLRHNIRKGNRQKEIYLGKRVPGNIEEIKQSFLLGFYLEEWIPALKEIRDGYASERRRMPDQAIQKEIGIFSIRFTYNTQRIEGSTLTLRETAALLEKGIAPSNKPMGDVREAEAHQKLFFEMLQSDKDLTLATICRWHKKVFIYTKLDIAGKIRDHEARISGSQFIPPKPEALRLLLKGFFRWYNNNKRKLYPVLLAALIHLKFVTIHPFADGNGRISRLMMNYVLSKLGYPMLDIDYADRRSYYNALERSQTKQNDIIFLQWFMRRYLKTNSKFLGSKNKENT